MAYSVELGDLMALDYSIDCRPRSSMLGLLYSNSDMNYGEVDRSDAL